jgi:hypothetical protein
VPAERRKGQTRTRTPSTLRSRKTTETFPPIILRSLKSPSSTSIIQLNFPFSARTSHHKSRSCYHINFRFHLSRGTPMTNVEIDLDLTLFEWWESHWRADSLQLANLMDSKTRQKHFQSKHESRIGIKPSYLLDTSRLEWTNAMNIQIKGWLVLFWKGL